MAFYRVSPEQIASISRYACDVAGIINPTFAVVFAKWRLNRSRFGIRIDHDLVCISDRGLASQSITIWHASDH